MMSGFWQRSWWQSPQNNGFKVLAAVLALLVWGYVTVNQNPLTEATFSVPVEIRSLGSDLAQPETNYQVQVRVQGTAGIIEELTSYDIAAYVDLTDMTAGGVTPIINIELPPNVALVSRSPESLELTLYPKVSQTFPVEVRIKGAPAAGYRALDAALTPEMITLSGSDLSISAVDTVFVTADMGGLEANYSKSLALEVRSADGQNITDHFTCYPSTVEVMIPVVQDQPDLLLPVRCSLQGEPAPGYKVSRVVVEPRIVQAFGPQKVLDEILSLETEGVSVEGLSASASFTPKLKVPAGVSLAQNEVTVAVQIEPVNSTTLSCALADFRSAPASLDWQCSVSSCRVTLSGTTTDLQAVAAADVKLYVDLSSLKEAGEYELPVEAELPAGVSLADIEPASVTVTVTAAEKEEP